MYGEYPAHTSYTRFAKHIIYDELRLAGGSFRITFAQCPILFAAKIFFLVGVG